MRICISRGIYAVVSLFITLLAVQPSRAGETLFTTQVPAVTNASDGPNVNYELGAAFSSNIGGQITAIRFWKAANETGTHTGHIWSSTGQSLASVTFTNETAVGWQLQALDSAFTITANMTYVVSVNTGGTYYVATLGGLSSQVTNQDLSSVVGNNGLYGAPGILPTSTFQNANYFRDIVFVPNRFLQSGNSCNGTYAGPFDGNVIVTNGQTCNLVNGSITGNITVNGGSLAINNSAIDGNVQVQGGSILSIGPSTAIGGNLQIQNIPQGTGQSQICDTTVQGNLQFQNNGAPVLIGDAATCAGNHFGGNLTIQNNTATASAIGNTISNNLTLEKNTAPTIVNGNIVTGNLQDQNNTASTIVNGNIVTGSLQDQYNSAPTQVFRNIVGNTLQCLQDSSITGGGNTAVQKQGQCAAF